MCPGRILKRVEPECAMRVALFTLSRLSRRSSLNRDFLQSLLSNWQQLTGSAFVHHLSIPIYGLIFGTASRRAACRWTGRSQSYLVGGFQYVRETGLPAVCRQSAGVDAAASTQAADKRQATSLPARQLECVQGIFQSFSCLFNNLSASL